MFTDENTLVNRFLQHVNTAGSPWIGMKIAKEFFYQRGRTDLVAISSGGQVIAFEAKLNRWRSALQQAYRNRCFADQSYVVLPEDVAEIAARHAGEFVRRGVGLCCVSKDGLDVLCGAKQEAPLQPWLRNEALAHVQVEGG